MEAPMVFQAGKLSLTMAADFRSVARLTDGARPLLHAWQKPLFSLGLREREGSLVRISAADAQQVSGTEEENRGVYVYSGFGLEGELQVQVTLTGGDGFHWQITVINSTAYAVEYLDFPSVTFDGALRKNGGDASVLWPYNEGVLVEDAALKPAMTEPVYPSQGNYAMFPYMVFAQFVLYMYADHGICILARDPGRSPKGIDFCCSESGTEFRTRLFSGCGFGADVKLPFEMEWTGFTGNWFDGAAIYRNWFEENLPEGLAVLSQREKLPDWYREDMPIVITYPVRGIHDMDEMIPNKLFPYVNVLPLVDRLSQQTKSTILVLLMHWEGTAPWAPPYVWPPYGGEAGFYALMDKLHEGGHLLGVYCSGSSYTKVSNLISSYDRTQIIRDQNLYRGFCAGPDQVVQLSRICTGQRSGYDICVANPLGRKLMDEAMAPLLQSGVDYVQAMDQNHGGTMYFCHSQAHGHPPVPGQWMVDESQQMFSRWRDLSPNTLLGCESAAAEPYLPVLSISDNRYELNYLYGRPVPVYSFLYHPYLHNFMGNQVCCPIEDTTLGLHYRIAYSFLAGDLITLVLNQEGEVVFQWGMRDFSHHADQAQVLSFVAQLQTWHKVFPALFRDGRMVKALEYCCEMLELPLKEAPWHCRERTVLSTAWETDGETVQLLVNYTGEDQACEIARPHGCVVSLLHADGRERMLTDDRIKLPARCSAALRIRRIVE